MLVNLLEETLNELKEEGLSFDSVSYISMDGYRIDVDTFTDLAAHTNYSNDYGHQVINNTLCIWGLNWVMFRYEYDGAEWWEVRKLPQDHKPRVPKHLYDPFSFEAQKEGEQS